MSDKSKHTIILWVSDSSGIASCHLNGSGLSFKESLVGRVIHRDDKWVAQLKDGSETEHETHSAARAEIERSVDGVML